MSLNSAGGAEGGGVRVSGVSGVSGVTVGSGRAGGGVGLEGSPGVWVGGWTGSAGAGGGTGRSGTVGVVGASLGVSLGVSVTGSGSRMTCARIGGTIPTRTVTTASIQNEGMELHRSRNEGFRGF